MQVVQPCKPSSSASFSTSFNNFEENPNTQIICVTWLRLCKLQGLQKICGMPQALQAARLAYGQFLRNGRGVLIYPVKI
jgi:hypothetical protein